MFPCDSTSLARWIFALNRHAGSSRWIFTLDLRAASAAVAVRAVASSRALWASTSLPPRCLALRLALLGHENNIQRPVGGQSAAIVSLAAWGLKRRPVSVLFDIVLRLWRHAA